MQVICSTLPVGYKTTNVYDIFLFFTESVHLHVLVEVALLLNLLGVIKQVKTYENNLLPAQRILSLFIYLKSLQISV